MPLFRSPKDLEFVKRINQELIEKVISEKITYYAISNQYSEKNFYGEAKEKIFDPPVEVYSLVEWLEQNITTTEFGQDIVYKIKVSILQKHLDEIMLKPYEGDMVEYDGQKFEITSVEVPQQIFGKAQENIGVHLNCVSVRESAFRTVISGTIDQPNRTYPDEPLSASLPIAGTYGFSYGNATFPFSSSV